MPPSKRKLPMEDDKPGSGTLEKTDAGEKNPAEVPAPSEQQMPDPLTWVPTLQDMDSSFGRAALILLLRRYKEIITMVVDEKIAEFDEEIKLRDDKIGKAHPYHAPGRTHTQP